MPPLPFTQAHPRTVHPSHRGWSRPAALFAKRCLRCGKQLVNRRGAATYDATRPCHPRP